MEIYKDGCKLARRGGDLMEGGPAGAFHLRGLFFLVKGSHFFDDGGCQSGAG